MSISQRNPVAPMALNAEFKTHDKTKYPFKQTPHKPKYHRIVLRSTDKISGTNNDAVFSMEGLPDLQGDGFLIVDTVVASNSVDANQISNNIWSVHLKQITQPTGYLTNGKMNDIIAVSRGYGYNTILNTQNALGIPIDCKSLCSQKNWNISFTFYEAAKSMTNNWIISLTIYEKGNSVFE
jgi:hypothetical protein